MGLQLQGLNKVVSFDCQNIHIIILFRIFAYNNVYCKNICFVSLKLHKTFCSQCAYRYNLSWEKLKGCAEGEHANNLLQNFSQIVENDQIDSVPSILFNDVYNETLDEHARDDFIAVICNLFDEKPDACF